MVKQKKKIKNARIAKLGKNEIGIMKAYEYSRFIIFCALPQSARKAILAPDEKGEWYTQVDFARTFKLEPATLSDWKHRQGFWDEVFKTRRDYFKERTGEVLDAVERKAKRTGDAAEAKVMLEYTGELKKDNDPSKISEDLAAALANISKVLR